MIKRIISAVVALALIIPLLIIGGKPFIVAVGLLSVLAYKEIVDLKKTHDNIPFLVQIIGMVNLLLLVFSEFDGYSVMFGITYKGIALTLVTMLLPVVFYKSDNYSTKTAFYMIGSILLLGTTFNVFILIRALGLYKFIYLILIATMTDTFAMLTGCLIGKHKLAETISPKKTWEGSIVGSLMGTTVAVLFYHYLISPITIKVVLLTLLLSIIGQFSDLIFSKIKRENDIKDFSNIMPGHGGILDRLDSLSIISLVYIILISLF